MRVNLRGYGSNNKDNLKSHPHVNLYIVLISMNNMLTNIVLLRSRYNIQGVNVNNGIWTMKVIINSYGSNIIYLELFYWSVLAKASTSTSAGDKEAFLFYQVVFVVVPNHKTATSRQPMKVKLGLQA